MLDEVHERTLSTDVALGLLRKVQRRRPDLRLVVSSASLDAPSFQSFFNTSVHPLDPLDTLAANVGGTAPLPCATLAIEGRQHPIEVFYLTSAAPNFLRATVDTVLQIHERDAHDSSRARSSQLHSGDILGAFIRLSHFATIKAFQRHSTNSHKKSSRILHFSTEFTEACKFVACGIFAVGFGNAGTAID